MSGASATARGPEREEPGPPPRSPSIVTRLTAVHAFALFLLCALISYLLDYSIRSALETDLHFAIDAEAKQIAAVIAQSDDPVEGVRLHLRTLAEARPRPRLAVRVREAGVTVARVDVPDDLLPLSSAAPPLDAPPPVTGAAVFSLVRPSGLREKWDYQLGLVRDARGRLFHVEVMGHRSEIDRFAGRFRVSLVTLVGPLLVASIIAARLYIRRTLEPLRHVTAAAARIGSKTLGERLDARRAPVEIARLVASFNDMLDRLEDAFRRLTEFGADLAHEMRTPLQNLRGEAEVALLHPRTSEQYKEILAGIIEECDALARIVDDVLLLSRVERHEEALEVAPFDLAQEVDDVREFFEDAAAARGVALAATASPRPLEVRGDRLMLRRAIANLVDNAIKYSDSGGRVVVTARVREGGGAAVEVADAGRGIAPEDLPRVFRRFYRVDKSRSRSTGGAGLGLGIARTIARAHGGDVTLDSRPGEGTRAALTVPAAPPAGGALAGGASPGGGAR
jgi:two-component system heavy metal sensor histidine kinase CusS